jgi:hypothetical protein
MLPPAPPLEFAKCLDRLEQILKILAYPLGAAWVYFQFARGRLFKPRLDPLLAGAMVTISGSRYLHVQLNVKNVGQSRVRFTQEGTALRILFSAPPYKEWVHHVTVDILRSGETLEPGEALHEEQLHPLPADMADQAVQMEMWLTGTRAMWRTVVVVIPNEEASNG